MRTALARRIFWCAIAAFLAWDWRHSPTVNLRLEPPLLAAGSGQASAGGHCSAAR
jgi:hypothetical protein